MKQTPTPKAWRHLVLVALLAMLTLPSDSGALQDQPPQPPAATNGDASEESTALQDQAPQPPAATIGDASEDSKALVCADPNNPWLQNRWDCIVMPVWNSVVENEATVAWSIVVFLGLLAASSWRYYFLKKEASQTILLGPVAVSGTLATDLDGRDAGLLLHTKLIEAHGELVRPKTFAASLFMLDGAAGDLISKSWEDKYSIQVNRQAGEFWPEEVRLTSQDALKVGSIEIPIAAIRRVSGWFLSWHPWRRAYLASVIHVSIVAESGDTRIFVYRNAVEKNAPTAVRERPPNRIRRGRPETR